MRKGLALARYSARSVGFYSRLAPSLYCSTYLLTVMKVIYITEKVSLAAATFHKTTRYSSV